MQSLRAALLMAQPTKGDPQKTVRQHFVPRFYLKNFADEDNNLSALDVRNRRIGRPRAYQSFGYERYFYAIETGVADNVSQEIEIWLGRLETMISDALPGIIDKILAYKQITEEDRYMLAVLMSMLWLRSPAMRAWQAQASADLTKQLVRMSASERIDRFSRSSPTPISDADRVSLLEMMRTGSYDVRTNNVTHLKMMVECLGYNGAGFANMFFGMDWKMLIAQGGVRFAASDSPVVEWFPPPTGFYGATFLERDKYFALTPQVCLLLVRPRNIGRIAKIKRKTLFKNDDDTVKTLNMLFASHARVAVYSGMRQTLSDLLDGATHPGKLERAYLEKYEAPWREYHTKARDSLM